MAFSLSAGASTGAAVVRRRTITALATNGETPPSPRDGEFHAEDNVVTKEMFLRDLLQGPESAATANNSTTGSTLHTADGVVVKRKRKKGGEYRVLDNRDILPFAVRLQTPDPYTHPEVKRHQAGGQKVKRRRDAVEEQIASTVYRTPGRGRGDDDDDEIQPTLLGEYSLDRHTTTGDALRLGGTEYRVVQHRCLYKYAGGQRFVMVRKILEVKEVGRLLSEEYLQRQWHATAPAAAAAPAAQAEGEEE